jgi:hypothetical protein
MYVKLTAKLAEVVEGVDLSAHSEGDVIDLSERDANLLILGGWAQLMPPPERLTYRTNERRSVGANRARSRRKMES